MLAQGKATEGDSFDFIGVKYVGLAAPVKFCCMHHSNCIDIVIVM